MVESYSKLFNITGHHDGSCSELLDEYNKIIKLNF